MPCEDPETIRNQRDSESESTRVGYGCEPLNQPKTLAVGHGPVDPELTTEDEQNRL